MAGLTRLLEGNWADLVWAQVFPYHPRMSMWTPAKASIHGSALLVPPWQNRVECHPLVQGEATRAPGGNHPAERGWL